MESSVTETLTAAIHQWLAGRDGRGLCQADDNQAFHWPCGNLAVRLSVVVDESGWRTSPSGSYREGEYRGRLEVLERIRRSLPADPDDCPQALSDVAATVVSWQRRIESRDPLWYRGVTALDGPRRD